MKKDLKSPDQLFFLNLSQWNFQKTEKISYSHIKGQIDVAIMLSPQTQIAWLKESRLTH